MHNITMVGNALYVALDLKLLFDSIVISLMFLEVSGQYSLVSDNAPQMLNAQNVDDFERELCRERWYRLDWQYILRPCLGRTVFGRNMYPSALQTNPLLSTVSSMDIKKAGEYSKLTIQTFTHFGMQKNIGGDTWRILITGPSSLQPIVHDLNNGQYEIPFLIVEPGLYKADIFMEGTLCNQYFDPPTDWFKKGDYNGHFQEPHMYKQYSGWPYMLTKRHWERLGGNSSTVQFQIQPRDEALYHSNMAKLEDWQKVCKIPDSCTFVWDGYGRWIKDQWKPYDESEHVVERPNWKEIKTAKRRRRGKLWLYGDCFAHHFFEMVSNKTLCRDIFKSCGESYNWVYPRLNPVHELDPSIHKKDPSDISIEKILKYLQAVLQRKDMDDDSAIVINLGLHLARSTSFAVYQQIIDGIIKLLEEYSGEAVWRTTTSIWKQIWKVHKRFQTNQRVQLFNAYAMSAMCTAGIPILDVFPMTASTWKQPADGIHYENSVIKPVDNVLLNYFKDDEKEK